MSDLSFAANFLLQVEFLDISYNSQEHKLYRDMISLFILFWLNSAEFNTNLEASNIA